MRANELHAALNEIKEIFVTGGASGAADDFDRLAKFVGQHEDRDLDEVVAEITAKLDPVARKQLGVARYVKRFNQAGLEEPRFQEVLSALRADKLMDANDIMRIAKDYGVIRISGKTRAAVLESLDKHFYWLLYNRDADAMAKRATPW